MTKVTMETNEGTVTLEVEDGFFVHEESKVFPFQVKVQSGSITQHSKE